MAKYVLREPAYVQGVYYFADARQPVQVELQDDVEPSRKWEPMDEAAKAAIARLPRQFKAKAERMAAKERPALPERMSRDALIARVKELEAAGAKPAEQPAGKPKEEGKPSGDGGKKGGAPTPPTPPTGKPKEEGKGGQGERPNDKPPF